MASTPALCPGQLPTVEMRWKSTPPNAGVLRGRVEVTLFSVKGSGVQSSGAVSAEPWVRDKWVSIKGVTPVTPESD